MLETEKPFGILMFGDGWSRDQRKQADAVIMKHDLQVFSYPPVANVLVANNGDMGLASQYAIDAAGNTAMLIRDLVDEPSRCAFDVKLDLAKSKQAPIDYDVHIMGLKAADRHWLKGDKGLITEESRMIGDKKFVFPLAGWSHKQVRTTLKKHYGVDLSGDIDTGDLHACHKCLGKGETVLCPKTGQIIPTVRWDREGNLRQVREYLGA